MSGDEGKPRRVKVLVQYEDMLVGIAVTKEDLLKRHWTVSQIRRHLQLYNRNAWTGGPFRPVYSRAQAEALEKTDWFQRSVAKAKARNAELARWAKKKKKK
ncbi:MAG TPA: hypothetical protein VFO40_19545 [Chthoniobacterales bacterium]|nr:hypothetical protein [Chthoniobacterales bacterium]